MKIGNQNMNQRQIGILNLLKKNKGVYITGQTLADDFSVSLRTIRNDINVINDELYAKKQSLIQSQNKKGYFYRSEVEGMVLLDNSKIRVNNMILLMLGNRKPMSITELSRKMHISESVISADIRIAKDYLKEYHLSIRDVGNDGLIIQGKEEDKRTLLTNGDILPYAAHGQGADEFIIDENIMSEIRDVVLNEFIEEKYNVPDLVVRNILVHVYVNVLRIRRNNLLNEFSIDPKLYEKEIRIARKVYEKLSGTYGIVINESEVDYLAYLLQIRNYDHNQVIEQSTQDLVLDILNVIKEKQGIDFTQDENLIMSLVLHYGPLKMRLQNKTMLVNPLIDEIRNKNSLAYDVAVLAGKYIEQREGKLTEDEIGYLAMHFMIALDKPEDSLSKKSILVICSSTRGNGLLIKHDLSKRFKETVGTIDVCSLSEIQNYETGKYDAVFTTVDEYASIPDRAIKVNYFLNDEDYRKIRDSLSDSTTEDLSQSLFAKERFLHLNCSDKDEVIRILCANDVQYGNGDPMLYASVMEREQMGFTEIGFQVAIPHPSQLFDNPSSICVGILEKPITWKEKKVQLIFLLNIQKGKRKQLKDLFALIAEIASDEKKTASLIACKEYESFIEQIKEYMEEMKNERY